MAVHYRTKGFVFKKDDRLESDRVFTVFTQDFGKIELYAKAIRKIASKLKSGIDVFSLSEIEFIQGKNRKTLTDASFIKKFNNLAQDLTKFETSCSMAEVLNNLISGQEKDENIFNLADETFVKLDSSPFPVSNSQLLYYYFFWNFISILGYKPEVSRCASCSKKLNPYGLYFSYKEGGVVCRVCSNFGKDAKKINSDAVKVLRLFLKKDWQVLSRLKIESFSINFLKEISDNYYNYILSSHSSKNNLREPAGML